MEPKDALIVALDVDTREEALGIARELADEVGAFKVGMQLFNSEGPDVVKRIQELGGRVFVDLKFHDIPNTVAAAGRVMARLGCAMFTLHAAGGSDMLQAAAQAVRDESAARGVDEPLILAVTVLTSIGQDQLAQEMLIRNASVEEVAAIWGRMAQACGIGGVVCSPREITAVRKACGPELRIVTPGIRPSWTEGLAADDQRRITTPAQAISLGANYIVVGRPITRAQNRLEAAKKIAAEIAEAKAGKEACSANER
ncbi:MAG: orotidine-5'-phosphate decarboxylase [Firmicutes bacterium]|nr:orotidine-5'-phosphate decarboxylase [Bacillota bacterium]